MSDYVPKIAIQDLYGVRFQHCWGCGPKNNGGLHLQSFPSQDGIRCICEVTPDSCYTGGVPNNLFGGMIAVIFDCHGTASAAWFAHHQKGLSLTKETVIGRFVTARLEIDYKTPTPIGKVIRVVSRVEEITDRKVIVLMDMMVDDKIRASARMVAVGVKDTM